MKKIFAALGVSFLIPACSAADSTVLAGIINTSGSVLVNDFRQPRAVWTAYHVNDPADHAELLAYVVFRKLGRHQISIELFDQSGTQIDHCDFEPQTVSKVPLIHTVTCSWGGRMPEGGVTLSISDRIDGNTNKVGEIFLVGK